MPDGTEMVRQMALERIDPDDGVKLDAILVSLAGLRADLHNAWCSERSDRIETEDLLPRWLREPVPEPTAEDYHAQAEALAAVMGGVATRVPVTT